MKFQRKTLLVATLGTAAQVVTAGLILLRQRGEVIQHVDVLVTHAPLIQAARQRLAQAFAQHPRWPPLRFVPLQDDDGRPLMDVITARDAHAAFTTIYRHLRDRKAEGWRVHFLIAGGRKPLALYGMTTAQVLFDEDDALWHLYSAGDFLLSKRLIPEPGDEVALVPIPFVPWHELTPWALGQDIDDPWSIVERARRQAIRERWAQARAFVQSLTEAERRVVALLVREGLSDRELAQRLHASERTIHNHLRHVYQKAASHWGLPRVTRSQLIALLHLYFVVQEE